MKFLISAVLLCSAVTVFTQQETAESYLKQGIVFYQKKLNVQAKEVLLKSLLKEKSGEAYYLLGNVHMNLCEYYWADDAYKRAYELDYEHSNSLFNLACANSLMNNDNNSFLYLIYNYLSGDLNTQRINNDPDLSSFRKSEKYKQLINFFSDNSGRKPVSVNEVVKYFTKKSFPTSDEPSPSTISFLENGEYAENACCGGTGFWTGGKWKLNRQTGAIIVSELGMVYSSSLEGTSRFPKTKKYPFKDSSGEIVGYYDSIPSNGYYIPMDDIRLDIYEIVENGFFDCMPIKGKKGALKHFHMLGRRKVYD